jgi:actin-related protein 6
LVLKPLKKTCFFFFGISKDKVLRYYVAQCQTLRLNNERFAVPELLFHPSDIGIQQKGVAEAVYDAVLACPEETRPHLLRNVLLTGGCSLFPGFCQRLSAELRKMSPIEMAVKVTLPKK